MGKLSRFIVNHCEDKEIGAFRIVKHRLFRVSVVVTAGGAVAAAMLSGAQVASASTPQAPSWHPVLSVQGGGQTDAVVATGKTTGWAFLTNGAAYHRVGATAWNKVAFPGTNGYVNPAAASSRSNVWAAFQSTIGGSGSQVDRWDGRQWSTVKSLPGSVTSLRVLGPDDVWVFGGAGVFHFNGHRWAKVSSPALSGGSLTSDRDVWAYHGTQIEHYDGPKWAETSLVGLFPAGTELRFAPVLTGVLALAPDNVFATGVGWAGVGGGPAVVLHFNGHRWSLAAAGPAYIINSATTLAPDGHGGLWMTSDTHENAEVLLHYSAGQFANANEPFMSVASIPGTTEALGGNASPVTTTPTVYQYS